ncbi:MAG: NAD(P)H-hydrate dehydratase [Chitinophagales bacterium]|nr:NAD(P)H-hydrate dehydratase [Chitinophagales bacterium]
MKILSAEQISQADAYTIQHEPIASIDLMERAGKAFVDWLESEFPNHTLFVIFCGYGNNGGDGYAIARLLLNKGYVVRVFTYKSDRLPSPDCAINAQRLGASIEIIVDAADFPKLAEDVLIIDALFGTGLSKPIQGIVVDLISYLNQLPNRRIAVDMPSGLMTDGPSSGVIIKAHRTLAFQLPKLSFLMPDNAAFVGDWSVLDIGLSKTFIKEVNTPFYYTTAEDIQLKQRAKYSHKGTYGHALIIGGSIGKIGAAVLSTEACLRAGSGLVSCCAPSVGLNVLQTTVPAAMVVMGGENYLTNLPELTAFNAIGVGPGMGTHTDTASLLYSLLNAVKVPLVLDADALNMLAVNPNLLELLPKNSILTPHPKEFARLFGETRNGFERLNLLREKSSKYGCIIILKGAHTSISSPEGEVWFNSTGNAGMATGGSGDVLTGIITGLLAQGYLPIEAARIGVYLHGLAGDLAAKETSMEAMIASDIIAYLGKAFLSLQATE